MRRILPLLLPVPALLAPLTAQAPSGISGQALDAWQQLVERRVQAGASPVVQAFLLFCPKSVASKWQAAEGFARLRVSGELGLPLLDEAEDKALKARMAWGPEPRWVLVSPKGEVLGNGSEAPDPGVIQKLMESAGWRSRWDRRAEFLRQNPSSGDAWGEELRDQAMFALQRALVVLGPEKGAADPSDDAARWGPISRALGGLTDVDGWTGWGRLGITTLVLRFGDTKVSDQLQAELEKLRRGAESALRRRPSSWNLWAAWDAALGSGEAGEPEALVASLEPAPSQPWPPLEATVALVHSYSAREDWAGLERLASQAITRDLSPQVMAGKNGRRHREQVLDAWAVPRVMALLRLHRVEDAATAAAEVRALAGPQWKELSTRIEGAASLVIRAESEAVPDRKAQDPEIPAALAEILKRDPAPEPSAPTLPPPLTLALVGEPAWAAAFHRLKEAPALDPWEPGEELAFGTVDAKLAQRLRARSGWGPEPHWVLLRGEELLDSGTELLDAKGFADRLRTQGAPLLEQLGAFLRRHPEHEEARQARLAELRSRMPNLRLEAVLLEDAKLLRAPFLDAVAGDGKWKPMKELWEPAAQRLLPELESRLRSWPEDAERWLGYVDWSNLHPRQPSPADLLATLPVWKTRVRGGAGPLPDEVGLAVAVRLEIQGRWESLAAWGRAFWEGGLREQMKADAQSRRRPGAVLAEWGDMEKRLVLPYREALVKLSRTAELRSLDQDLKDVRGVLPPPPRPRSKS